MRPLGYGDFFSNLMPDLSSNTTGWLLVVCAVASVLTLVVAVTYRAALAAASRATTRKLDDVVRTVREATTGLVDLEGLDDDDARALQREFARIRRDEPEHRDPLVALATAVTRLRVQRRDAGKATPGDKGARAERAEPGERRPRGERLEREERAPRGKREPRADRAERPERPERGERPDRGERPERKEGQEPRPPRGERKERAERPERGERQERQERPERSERQPRADGARRERPPRQPRPDAEQGAPIAESSGETPMVVPDRMPAPPELVRPLGADVDGLVTVDRAPHGDGEREAAAERSPYRSADEASAAPAAERALEPVRAERAPALPDDDRDDGDEDADGDGDGEGGEDEDIDVAAAGGAEGGDLDAAASGAEGTPGEVSERKRRRRRRRGRGRSSPS